MIEGSGSAKLQEGQDTVRPTDLMRYLASLPLQATRRLCIFSPFLVVLACPVIEAISRSF